MACSPRGSYIYGPCYINLHNPPVLIRSDNDTYRDGADALHQFKRSCARKLVRNLDLEECRNDTLLPLRPTRPTLLDILGVLGRDDVLARIGVVHDGVGVREEAVEAPVEDAGGDEGVDVADVETAQVEALA